MRLQDMPVAIAAALEPLAFEIPDLQVYPYWNDNPTPPSLDVYPADPFQDGAGFGADQALVTFTVRARVATGDNEAAQKLLLRMLDTTDPASIEQALSDVAVASPQGVSGLREYVDNTDANGQRMLGCEWRMRMFT